jgi:hypothetical protein
MIFTYKKWDCFCAQLQRTGYQSIPACLITSDSGNYLVLKHDIPDFDPEAVQAIIGADDTLDL